MQCNMLEAKNQLSKLVQAALAGEDVVIANNGVPVVRLVKVGARDFCPQARRMVGAPEGQDGLGFIRYECRHRRGAHRWRIVVRRYLLDTHLIYWWMTADARLGRATRGIISRSEIIVSVASLWEMALKNTRGKLPLPQGEISEQLEAQGFVLLSILPRHIEAVRRSTCALADPFDRLLIAQADDERSTLLTRDAAILSLGLHGVAKG